MVIDEVKVRKRLETKHSELRREITALLDEEASLGLSSPGVEDTGDTAQDIQAVQQDNSMLLNERHLLAAVEEALRRLQDGTYGSASTVDSRSQRNTSKPFPGQYGTEHARNDVKYESSQEATAQVARYLRYTTIRAMCGANNSDYTLPLLG